MFLELDDNMVLKNERFRNNREGMRGLIKSVIGFIPMIDLEKVWCIDYSFN